MCRGDWGELMAEAGVLAAGVRRGAVALTSSVGSAVVQVRMPAPPVAGDDGEQLGLRAPEFVTKPLGPVVVRSKSGKVAVTVPAETLERFTGLSEPGAVCTAMAAAAGVVIGDQAYVLTGTDVLEAGGCACLYQLLLEPKPQEVS